MFIRVVKKKNSKEGKIFCQYMLCQSSRINGKVVQQSIMSLGSEIELSDATFRANVLEIVRNKIFNTETLFSNYSSNEIAFAEKIYQKFKIKFEGRTDYKEIVKSPPKHDGSDFQEIDVNSIDTLSAKTFGAETICLQMYQELGIEKILRDLEFTDNQLEMAKLSILSRTIFSASEHKTAQILELNSALKEVLGIDRKITHRDLYPILDNLQSAKDKIDKALYDNISGLFSVDASIVIYDISNVYFEGRKENNELCQYGRNKQKRNDCKQVVFTGVIDNLGFIKHSRIYKGNMAESKTMADLIGDFENQGTDLKNVTLVIDAGFATEENLKLLKEKGLKYVSVARQKLKDYSLDSENMITTKDNNGESIQLQIVKNQQYDDTWLAVKSAQKEKKETSMSTKLEKTFLAELESLNNGLIKPKASKNLLKITERIGRLKEKHAFVSKNFIVETEYENDIVSKITWTKKAFAISNEGKNGIYFIRTNIEQTEEIKIWTIYNLIREVESTFRCLKSDLLIRPIHHQTDERIQGHIYQTLLAYQIVNAIRTKLKEKNIKDDWQNIVRVLSTQTLNQIQLKTKTKTLIITKPAVPIQEVKNLYQILNYSYSHKIIRKDVVYH